MCRYYITLKAPLSQHISPIPNDSLLPILVHYQHRFVLSVFNVLGVFPPCAQCSRIQSDPVQDNSACWRWINEHAIVLCSPVYFERLAIWARALAFLHLRRARRALTSVQGTLIISHSSVERRRGGEESQSARAVCKPGACRRGWRYHRNDRRKPSCPTSAFTHSTHFTGKQ